MSLFRNVARGLRSLFRKEQVSRELDEELNGFLEMAAEEKMKQGMSRKDALREVRLERGSLEVTKEVIRATGWESFVETMWQDLRFAARTLRKNPGFTTCVITILTLGISASVTMFGFVDAALIKPLPYRDPSRLVGIFETTPTNGKSAVSYLDFLDWASLNRPFDSVAAYALNGGFTLSATAGAERVGGTRVSEGFFRTLGVTPVLGRDFLGGKNSSAAPRTVMLSYAAWQDRYAGRHDVLGQAVTLNGLPNVIIGVLPPNFNFASVGAAEFWGTLQATDPCEQRRGCHNLNVVGRLKDGVSVQSALADMKFLAKELERQFPDSNRDQGANVMLLSDVIVGDIRPILLALLVGAGLLLLIASVNIMSLLLARSNNRRREIAVRGALGASSARLVRQFATEGLLLVAVGLPLSLIFANWGMRLLLALIPINVMRSMPYLQGLGINFHIITFACIISLIAGVVFAFVPALRVSLSDGRDGLTEGSRGSTGTMWRSFGANLVIAELVIAVVLLVSAGLLSKSLYRLLHVDTGFTAEHLATLQVEAPSFNYWKDEQVIALQRRILEQIASLPGVKSVGICTTPPVSSGWGTTWFQIVGRPYHGEHNEAYNRQVSASYFTALQARLLLGRYFTEFEDASKPRVVIINEILMKEYFPKENPIGKQISYTPTQPMEIVGVVADIKEGPLDQESRPALYVPIEQNPLSGFSVVVRTSQAEQSLSPVMTAAIHGIDPAISISGQASMSNIINQSPSAAIHRSSAWVVGGFAAIAFLLGVFGLYGVVAYSVSQRTREIGIRMALGAPRKSVFHLILNEAGRLTAIGVAVGLVCSEAAASLIRGLLFGIQSWDVPTLSAVAALLTVSALVASYIPARCATRVDPMVALRYE